METWLSGRKRFTANEVGFKRPRGFESHRLRKTRSKRYAVSVRGGCLRFPSAKFQFGGDDEWGAYVEFKLCAYRVGKLNLHT